MLVASLICCVIYRSIGVDWRTTNAPSSPSVVAFAAGASFCHMRSRLCGGRVLRLLFVIALVFAVGFLLFGGVYFAGFSDFGNSALTRSLRCAPAVASMPSHRMTSIVLPSKTTGAQQCGDSRTRRESFVLFSRSSEMRRMRPIFRIS